MTCAGTLSNYLPRDHYEKGVRTVISRQASQDERTGGEVGRPIQEDPSLARTHRDRDKSSSAER